MSNKFLLTAELQIRGPANLGQVRRNIKSGLKDVNIDVNIEGAARAKKDIDAVTQATNRATKAQANLGRTVAISLKRFATYSIATRAVGLLTTGLSSAVGEAISFEREMLKVSQVSGKTMQQLSGLSDEITRLATSLGVASDSLLGVTRILTQAGLSAGETKIALEALAKSELAPTFDNITQTAEGAVAIFNQFKEGAGALEEQLGAINAVSGKFAVESGDLIAAVRRVGGVFKASGGELNELLGLFTSIRATTRESGESIATGLRTIFVRLQRPRTLDFLEEMGVSLTDMEGKFVGPLEAVKRMNEEFSKFEDQDPRFIKVAEEIAGFRQIGKVIPLLQQFKVAQDAIAVADSGKDSLAKDAAAAQASLAVRIVKVKEEFLGLVREIYNSDAFQAMADSTLRLLSALIKVGDALKNIIPILGVFAGIKVVKSAASFVGNVGRNLASPKGFNRGGAIGGSQGVPYSVSGSRDDTLIHAQTGEFVVNRSSSSKIGLRALNYMNEKGEIPAYENGGSIGKKQAFIQDSFDRESGRVIKDVPEAQAVMDNFIDELKKFGNMFQYIKKQGVSALSKSEAKEYEGLAHEDGGIGIALGSATDQTVRHETAHQIDREIGSRAPGQYTQFAPFASEQDGTFQNAVTEKLKPILQKQLEKEGASLDEIQYRLKNEEIFADLMAKTTPKARAILVHTTSAEKGLKTLSALLNQQPDVPGFAGLTSKKIGTLPRKKSFKKPSYFYRGGSGGGVEDIDFKPRGRDVKPAMIAEDEFVVTNVGVGVLGAHNLAKANKGQKPSYLYKGGYVSGGVSYLATGNVAARDSSFDRNKNVFNVAPDTFEEMASTIEKIIARVSKINPSLSKTLQRVQAVKIKQLSEQERRVKGNSGRSLQDQINSGEKVYGQATHDGKVVLGNAANKYVAKHEAGHQVDRALTGGRGLSSRREGSFQNVVAKKLDERYVASQRASGVSEEQIKKDSYRRDPAELFADAFAQAPKNIQELLASTTDAKEGAKLMAKAMKDAGKEIPGLADLEASDFIGNAPSAPVSPNKQRRRPSTSRIPLPPKPSRPGGPKPPETKKSSELEQSESIFGGALDGFTGRLAVAGLGFSAVASVLDGMVEPGSDLADKLNALQSAVVRFGTTFAIFYQIIKKSKEVEESRKLAKEQKSYDDNQSQLKLNLGELIEQKEGFSKQADQQDELANKAIAKRDAAKKVREGLVGSLKAQESVVSAKESSISDQKSNVATVEDRIARKRSKIASNDEFNRSYDRSKYNRDRKIVADPKNRGTKKAEEAKKRIDRSRNGNRRLEQSIKADEAIIARKNALIAKEEQLLATEQAIAEKQRKAIANVEKGIASHEQERVSRQTKRNEFDSQATKADYEIQRIENQIDPEPEAEGFAPTDIRPPQQKYKSEAETRGLQAQQKAVLPPDDGPSDITNEGSSGKKRKSFQRRPVAGVRMGGKDYDPEDDPFNNLSDSFRKLDQAIESKFDSAAKSMENSVKKAKEVIQKGTGSLKSRGSKFSSFVSSGVSSVKSSASKIRGRGFKGNLKAAGNSCLDFSDNVFESAGRLGSKVKGAPRRLGRRARGLSSKLLGGFKGGGGGGAISSISKAAKGLVGKMGGLSGVFGFAGAAIAGLAQAVSAVADYMRNKYLKKAEKNLEEGDYDQFRSNTTLANQAGQVSSVAQGVGNGALVGGAAGAAIGSFVPVPVIGTAVGAIVGSVLGAVGGGLYSASGQTRDFEAESAIETSIMEDATKKAGEALNDFSKGVIDVNQLLDKQTTTSKARNKALFNKSAIAAQERISKVDDGRGTFQIITDFIGNAAMNVRDGFLAIFSGDFWSSIGDSIASGFKSASQYVMESLGEVALYFASFVDSDAAAQLEEIQGARAEKARLEREAATRLTEDDKREVKLNFITDRGSKLQALGAIEGNDKLKRSEKDLAQQQLLDNTKAEFEENKKSIADTADVDGDGTLNQTEIARRDTLLKLNNDAMKETLEALKSDIAGKRQLEALRNEVVKAEAASLAATSRLNAASSKLEANMGLANGTLSSFSANLKTIESAKTNVGLSDEANKLISKNVVSGLQSLGIKPSDKDPLAQQVVKEAKFQQESNSLFDRVSQDFAKIQVKGLGPDAKASDAAKQFTDIVNSSGNGKSELAKTMKGLFRSNVVKAAGGSEGEITPAALEEARRKTMEQLGPLLKSNTKTLQAFNDAVQKLEAFKLERLQEQIRLENELANTRLAGVDLAREAEKIIEEAGGPKARSGVAVALEKQNVLNKEAGVSEISNPADIAGNIKEIEKALATARSNVSSGKFDGDQEGLAKEQDKINDLTNAMQQQASTIREVNSAKQEELDLIGRKNKLEKDSIDSLIKGDIAEFFKKQSAVGATAAAASGDDRLIGLFGASAIGEALSDVQSQKDAGVTSLFGQDIDSIQTRLRTSGLERRGFNAEDAASAARFASGQSPQELRKKAEIRANAENFNVLRRATENDAQAAVNSGNEVTKRISSKFKEDINNQAARAQFESVENTLNAAIDESKKSADRVVSSISAKQDEGSKAKTPKNGEDKIQNGQMLENLKITAQVVNLYGNVNDTNLASSVVSSVPYSSDKTVAVSSSSGSKSLDSASRLASSFFSSLKPSVEFLDNGISKALDSASSVYGINVATPQQQAATNVVTSTTATTNNGSAGSPNGVPTGADPTKSNNGVSPSYFSENDVKNFKIFLEATQKLSAAVEKLAASDIKIKIDPMTVTLNVTGPNILAYVTKEARNAVADEVREQIRALKSGTK